MHVNLRQLLTSTERIQADMKNRVHLDLMQNELQEFEINIMYFIVI